MDDQQVDDDVRAHLGSDVTVKPYDSFFSYLECLGAELGLSKDAVTTFALGGVGCA